MDKMKNKVYIMDNEEQEQNILTKLENEGCVWHSDSTKPTEYIPSKHFIIGEKFPTAIVKLFNNRIMYETNYEDDNIKQDEEIVYDGRKMEEEQMSEKYVVSQEFMNTLVKWKDEHETELEVSLTKLIDPHEVTYLATIVDDWWLDHNISEKERNNRLIAIIRWVNGEDVFEVEKPKKWVVRSKDTDEDDYYWYVSFTSINQGFCVADNDIMLDGATRFDTKEEAESWANAHQEVVEVVDV